MRLGGSDDRLVQFANIPSSIARVVASRYATLHELQSVYGAEDLYNLLEVIAVDTYNHNVMSQGD